jgi:hypothetical protein
MDFLAENPLDLLSFNDLQELGLVLSGSGLLSRSNSNESLESLSDIEDTPQLPRYYIKKILFLKHI